MPDGTWKRPTLRESCSKTSLLLAGARGLMLGFWTGKVAKWTGIIT